MVDKSHNRDVFSSIGNSCDMISEIFSDKIDMLNAGELPGDEEHKSFLKLAV